MLGNPETEEQTELNLDQPLRRKKPENQREEEEAECEIKQK